MGRICGTSGERRGMYIEFWWGNQKERDHLADHDVSGWIILTWTLEI
jgi:hypothetical protein